MSLVLIYDKCKQHAEKVYKTFYFLKISGNLRLLDYYGGCAPVHVYGLRNFTVNKDVCDTNKELFEIIRGHISF